MKWHDVIKAKAHGALCFRLKNMQFLSNGREVEDLEMSSRPYGGGSLRLNMFDFGVCVCVLGGVP